MEEGTDKLITPERRRRLISLMRRAYVLGDQSDELLKLDDLYVLEGLDEKHRDKVALNVKYSEWKALPTTSENNSFWSWLEEKYPDFSEKQSVVYLNKQQRESYKLFIRDDLIYRKDNSKVSI